MKALSFWQPWAWLCCEPRPADPRFPIKDIENRTWYTDFRGRIYVHAAKKVEMEAFGIDLRDKLSAYPGLWNQLQEMCRTWKEGAIIGEVDITDCYHAVSKWSVPGQWQWLLANPVRYETPIPYRGQRLFFEVKL